MTAIIAYYRVSTKQQGASGLGLEAQQATVVAHARATGGVIKASYTEIESGKRSDRPEFLKALGHAKRIKATLVVAKLDRLSRNVVFVGTLMESKVPFVCCDNPNATPLTIHILAAVAEDELKRISARTREAAQAAKARGTLFGSARPGHWDGREDQRLAGLVKARAKAAVAVAQAARKAYNDILPEMQQQRAAGLSLAAIAAKLNEQGDVSRRGKPWNAMQVSRVLARA